MEKVMAMAMKGEQQGSARQEAVQMILTGLVALVVTALVMGFAADVYAAGSGMPWESTLNKVLASLQGPVARFVGVVAIVVTGLTFALGEGGGFFKQGAGIVFGLSVAFSASTFITDFGFAGGALF
jgi:type IV secretory pathway VirB2 component (pilin)